MLAWGGGGESNLKHCFVKIHITLFDIVNLGKPIHKRSSQIALPSGERAWIVCTGRRGRESSDFTCSFFICVRRTYTWINMKFIFWIKSKCTVWKPIFFCKKLYYRFILLCNRTVCSGFCFSRELSFLSSQFTKILFTHIFSHPSVLDEAKCVCSLQNAGSGSNSRITVAVWSFFTGVTFLCLSTYEGPALEAGRLCRLATLGPRISYLMSLSFRSHFSKHQNNTYFKDLL